MRLSRLFPCLLLVLLAAFPAAAQDATPETTAESTDPRAFVLQAIANLNELPGYHFAYETRSEIILTGDEDNITTASITTVEGDALANGDSFVTILLAPGESFELAEATPRIHIERTIFNGKSAINFQLEDSIYADILPFEDGWQSYDDLIASAEGFNAQIIVDNVNNTVLPTAFFPDETLIEVVTEIAPEMIDSVFMRVFDLELNALGVSMANSTEDQLASFEDLLKNLNLLAASQMTATQRLWIGADDGQIYRSMIQSASSIPYLSSGHQDQAPYDVTTATTTDLTISAHGEAIEIEPVVFPD